MGDLWWLAARVQEQGDLLEKRTQERDEARAALRAFMNVLEIHHPEVYKRKSFLAIEIADYPIVAAVVQARAVLKE